MFKHTLIPCTIACLLFLSSCSMSSEDGASGFSPPVIPITMGEVQQKDITSNLETLGSLLPSVIVDIRPKADGHLIDTLVEEGQNVVPGTPLFKIDPSSYELRVREAEAQLAIDQATLRGVEKKIERYRGLAEKDIVAKTEWDDLLAQKERSEATVTYDHARLDSARLQLDHCVVMCPINGRVGKVDAHIGQLVTNSQPTPLGTVAKLDPLIIEFYVTEKEYLQIRDEVPEIQLSTICTGQTGKTAKVTFLDNQFDSTNGLLLVRGKVENSNGCLRPGQTVKVKVPLYKKEGVLVVPQKAIRFNQKGPYVYVVNDDNTVSLRQVVLGTDEGQEQIVMEGLSSSEKIVLDGHLRLSDGSKVEIKQ